MDIQFILEKVHKRSIFSIRAYRILFTDSEIFFVHLGEDSSQLPLGQAMGGLVGAAAQSIANKMSEKEISKKLNQLENEDINRTIASDKRNFKTAYSQLDGFESAPYKWNCWPHITFKIRGKGDSKFTFDTQMEDLEEERQAIIGFMRGKRPDLVKSR